MSGITQNIILEVSEMEDLVLMATEKLMEEEVEVCTVKAEEAKKNILSEN